MVELLENCVQQIKFALMTQPTPAIPNKVVPIAQVSANPKEPQYPIDNQKTWARIEKATRDYLLRAEEGVL
ncbi:MAG: hypothetical protein Q8L02_04195 [Candidatus Nitrotoga sp.]|nr:hypothetical protein [Candidatus Nitrotoga sp.]